MKVVNTLKWLIIIAVAATIIISFTKKEDQVPVEKDKRMEWFRDAKFGLFIHFGIYTVPAGEWNGKTTYGEWLREEAQIPIDEYNKFITFITNTLSKP